MNPVAGILLSDAHSLWNEPGNAGGEDTACWGLRADFNFQPLLLNFLTPINICG